jgi:hypothetical protein
MRRKKRFTLRLVAVGFAVAALGAPAAQAMPEGVTGVELRGLHESQVLAVKTDKVVAPHAATYSYPHGPSRVDTTPAAPPQIADDAGGFEIGTVALSGIVLLVAAGGAIAIVIRESRKGKLAHA